VRLAAVSVVVLIVLAVGCGYVGPVLPPSPEIPATTTDLHAIERGDKIIVTFSTPARTTDGVAIKQFSNVEVLITPGQGTPGAAKSYALDLPSPSDRDDPQPKPMNYTLDVADWIGRHIVIEARTSVKKHGHFSAWSNRVEFDAIPPLAAPVVHAESSAEGIVLSWPANDDAQYRIQRQGPSDKLPLDLATANQSRYVDISAQYDTPYTYIITAAKGRSESLPSEPVTYLAVDIYPPAVPTGLSVAVGPDAVDLAWQRNAEADFQGYYIYRSTDGGPYQRQGGRIALPTYSDHNVEHGKTYSYKISASDKKGNESAESSPAEVQY
jgi:hypothetical protein